MTHKEAEFGCGVCVYGHVCLGGSAVGKAGKEGQQKQAMNFYLGKQKKKGSQINDAI